MTEQYFSDALSSVFYKRGYSSRREVNSGYGIADIVLAKKNKKHCELRKRHGQNMTLKTEKFFTVLKHMPDINDDVSPVSFNFLQNKTKLSTSYLKYNILYELHNFNFIKIVDNKYCKVNGWMPIAHELLAIESKLRDWKKGIKQACRYKTFANKVYLAVPPNITHLVDHDQLKRNKLGLISFDPEKKVVDIVLEASANEPNRSDKRNFVAEHFWDEFLQ